MIIYLDIIFLENALINFILLFSAGIFIKKEMKCIRLAIASLMGACFSVLFCIYTVNWVLGVIVRAVLSLGIVKVAYDIKNKVEFKKMVSAFFLTTFVFSGVSVAVIIKDEWGRMNILNMIIGMALIGGGVIYYSFKYNVKKISKDDIAYKVSACVGGKRLEVDAILDTGNMLKDPIGGLPVIVVEYQYIKDEAGEDVNEFLEFMITGKGCSDYLLEKYSKSVKYIPFKSVGKDGGVLVGIKVKEVLIKQTRSEECTMLEEAVFGMYEGRIEKSEKYRALIGINAL